MDYEDLPEETDNPDDLKEILCFVAAHKEWIDVEEIYNRILSVANDIDGEMCEELNEVVARLRDGEKVIARDNFDDYKIDDEYDAAMRAFIAAEEYEKELIHDGFMSELTVANYKGETSNEIDYYPHVAVKATEGDERALEIAQMLENI